MTIRKADFLRVCSVLEMENGETGVVLNASGGHQYALCSKSKDKLFIIGSGESSDEPFDYWSGSSTFSRLSVGILQKGIVTVPVEDT